MRKTEINFTIELDEQKFPDKIYWDATDNPNEGINETRAVAIAVWDQYHKSTLKIDLWTKQMEVFDMKQFYIEILRGIADTLVNSTGDTQAAKKIDNLCKELAHDLREEIKAAQRGEGAS